MPAPGTQNGEEVPSSDGSEDLFVVFVRACDRSLEGGWGWGWGEAQTITKLYREGRWVLMCLSGVWEFVARNEELQADNCCGQPCCFFPIQRLPV